MRVCVLCVSWCCLSLGVAAGVAQEAPPKALQQQLAAGQAAYQTQDYKAAEAIFRGILAAVPGEFAANEFLGLVLSAEGQARDATRYFRAAVQASPRSAAAHLNLGTNLAQL